MKLFYDHKIEKKLIDEQTIKKYYGKLSDKILIRISLLIAADRLSDIPNVPPTRRHKLSGKYEKCWAVDLDKNWRIIIKPVSNQDLEPSDIDEIVVIDIVDYH